MKTTTTQLSLVLLFHVACGSPQVPHYIAPDGEDLGAAVPSRSAPATYYAPLGGVVSWSPDWLVLYSEPGCVGDEGVASADGDVPDAVAHPRSGYLHRVERQPQETAARSYFLVSQRRCADATATALWLHRLAPTDLPGRPYAARELRVELR